MGDAEDGKQGPLSLPGKQGWVAPSMLFPRVSFRNDEQEGLGKTGCTEVIIVGWVSLGSPSGNSRPLLQENQMAKGDSLDSMCWNCTDVVVRRIRKGKRKRQSTVILTILKLSCFFFLFSWGCYAPWTSVHSCCCSLSRVVLNIRWKPVLWAGHWLVWPRKALSLLDCTCHSSGKDFSLVFFHFVSVML